MKFGILKSKIEKKLETSFLKEGFEKEIKTFKEIVLENKDISKIYHIYNELSTNKSFEHSFAEDFVNECIDLYSRIKINQKNISLIEEWVKDTNTENKYTDIDNVLDKQTIVIENIILSKKRIVENLTKKEEKKDVVNIPLEKAYEIAKENLKNHLSELNESELKEIHKYSTLTEQELKTRFDVLSEMVIEKLEKLSSNSDKETSAKITETINKIKSEEINSISLLKLKTLNENL